MSEKSIEKILRESFTPSLPYGFAERVAQAAMAPETDGEWSLWDSLAFLSPKVEIALGAVAALLTVLSVAGSGPGVLDAMEGYAVLNNLVPLM